MMCTFKNFVVSSMGLLVDRPWSFPGYFDSPFASVVCCLDEMCLSEKKKQVFFQTKYT